MGNSRQHRGSSLRDRIRSHTSRLDHGSNTDRTVFFSDAVFAIAMTLLVLDLKLPDMDSSTTGAELQGALLARAGPFAAFVLSFILVGRLWLNHHRRFAAIKSYDARLQSINLATLFFVAFLPVPTSLLFQANGQSPWPPVLYALTISGGFVCLRWLWSHARRTKLMHGWVDPVLYRIVLHGTDPVAAVFLLSIPVAFISPVWGMYFWILLWPVSMLHGKWRQRRLLRDGTRRDDEAQAPGRAS